MSAIFLFVSLLVCTHSFGATWSAPFQLSKDGQNAFTPRAAIDSSGNAVVAWNRLNDTGTTYIIQASIYTRSTNTLSAIRTLSDPGNNSYTPAVSMNSSGNAVVVWYRQVTDPTNTLVTRPTIQAQLYKWSNAKWTATSNITKSTINSYNPEVELDNNGKITLIYRQLGVNAISNAIMQLTTAFSSIYNGGAWPTSQNLSETKLSAFTAAIPPELPQDTDFVINNNKQGIAVWTQLNSESVPKTVVMAAILSDL
jgi:hypothetical protein